jgi:hypothetical protein
MVVPFDHRLTTLAAISRKTPSAHLTRILIVQNLSMCALWPSKSSVHPLVFGTENRVNSATACLMIGERFGSPSSKGLAWDDRRGIATIATCGFRGPPAS